jgi:toxin ParE1/3/4
MIVVLTEDAEADLEHIGNSIAEYNPQRAASLVLELRRRCELIVQAPRRHSLVPRYEHTGIRRIVHGNYLVFYRVDAEAIAIVRILHGAMNYETIVFPES